MIKIVCLFHNLFGLSTNLNLFLFYENFVLIQIHFVNTQTYIKFTNIENTLNGRINSILPLSLLINFKA